MFEKGEKLGRFGAMVRLGLVGKEGKRDRREDSSVPMGV